jgi:hypothetical protein
MEALPGPVRKFVNRYESVRDFGFGWRFLDLELCRYRF